MSLLKRKRPESSETSKKLSSDEQNVYNAIKSKTNMGIPKLVLKRELKMRDTAFNSCIKTLTDMAKIKQIKSVNSKGIHLIAVEFKPSNEVTGSWWYKDGNFNTELVEKLKKTCLDFIRGQKFAAAEQVFVLVKNSKEFADKISVDQIKEVLEALVLDKEVVKVKSTGSREYASIPAGKSCYRIIAKTQKTGDMILVPCGGCPRINQCTPDGVISPTSCEYFKQWLDF